MVHTSTVVLVLLAVGRARADASVCERVITDKEGLEWRFNLTNLTAAQDYEVNTHRGKLSLNVCRPPQATCRPQGMTNVPPTTATSILSWGNPPEASCQKLGWGALGRTGSHWTLIDPAGAHEGVRVIHYDLTTWSGVALSNASGRAVADEFGALRPPALVVDFVCDPSAPLPAKPLQEISLNAQASADLTIRVLSPSACPVIIPCSVPGGTTVNTGVVAAAVAAAAAARNGTPPPSPNGFALLLFLFIGVGVLALLVIWFAPHSAGKRTLSSAAAWPTAWPAAVDHTYQGVHGALAADEEPGSRSDVYRAI